MKYFYGIAFFSARNIGGEDGNGTIVTAKRRILVTHNLVLLNIKEILNKHLHILTINSSFTETLNNIQPMIAFCKNASLKQLKHSKKQPKVSHSYTNNNRSMNPMLHQSITLLPTSSQNNNIYKHPNPKHLIIFH